MPQDTEAPPINDASPTVPVAAAVSIKLPPFWTANPTLWFLQIEAQFSSRSITAERTRFDYVVGTLAPEIAQEIEDIITAPPATEPYTALKSALISRLTSSQSRRVEEFLAINELGDRSRHNFCDTCAAS